MRYNRTAVSRITGASHEEPSSVAPLPPLSENAYKSILGVKDALPLRLGPKAASFATLDRVGKDVVAELFSLGQLPLEVALRLKVPKIHFTEWLRQAFTDEEMAELARHHAEACILRAQALLMAPVYDKTEASQLRQLAMLLTQVASSVDPGQWALRSRAPTEASLPTASSKPYTPPNPEQAGNAPNVSFIANFAGQTDEGHRAHNEAMTKAYAQDVPYRPKVINGEKAPPPRRTVDDVFES